MKSIFLITASLFLILAGQGQSTTVLINFGAQAYETPEYNYYKNFTTGLKTLKYSNGSGASPFTLLATRTGGVGNTETNKGNNGLNVGVSTTSDLVNNNWLAISGTVSLDGITNTGGAGYDTGGATFTLGGLTAGETYSVFMLTGRGWTGMNGADGIATFTGVESYSNLTQISGTVGNVTPTINSFTDNTLSLSGLTLRSNVQNYTELTFVASGSELSIQFATGTGYAVQAMGLKHIDLTQIPEPTSITLGAIALAGLALRRRRN